MLQDTKGRYKQTDRATNLITLFLLPNCMEMIGKATKISNNGSSHLTFVGWITLYYGLTHKHTYTLRFLLKVVEAHVVV